MSRYRLIVVRVDRGTPISAAAEPGNSRSMPRRLRSAQGAKMWGSQHDHCTWDSISARAEPERVTRGRAHHQPLRRRPVDVRESASSSLRHRLPDAAQRSGSRGRRPGRLGALADGRSQPGSGCRRIPRGHGDTIGDQRHAVGTLAPRDERWALAAGISRHDHRPCLGRGTTGGAGVGGPALAGEPIAKRTSRVHPSGGVRLSIPRDCERPSG